MVRTRVMGLNCSRRILGEDRRVRLRQTCHSAKLFPVLIASIPRTGAASAARCVVGVLPIIWWTARVIAPAFSRDPAENERGRQLMPGGPQIVFTASAPSVTDCSCLWG